MHLDASSAFEEPEEPLELDVGLKRDVVVLPQRSVHVSVKATPAPHTRMIPNMHTIDETFEAPDARVCMLTALGF